MERCLKKASGTALHTANNLAQHRLQVHVHTDIRMHIYMFPLFLPHSCSTHINSLTLKKHSVLSHPQGQHSAALIDFQTQSMLLRNCIVNQCLSKSRQCLGLHSPFLQIGYEGIYSALCVAWIPHTHPRGTLFPQSSQVTHLSTYYIFLLPICFSFPLSDWAKLQMSLSYNLTPQCSLTRFDFLCFFFLDNIY